MDVCGQLPQVPLFLLPLEKTFTLQVSGFGGQTPSSGTFEDTLRVPLCDKCHPSPKALLPAVHVCVCTSVFAYVHACGHVVRVYVHKCVCLCVFAYVHACVCIFTCACAPWCVCVCTP